VMLALARLFGVRTVATVHGLDWQQSKWGPFASAYLRLGERVIARYADEVIVLSPSARERFRAVYGRNTHLIGNGITPVRRVPCREITRRWGLRTGGYVLFLGRVSQAKGLHYLIPAFSRCDTELELVVAGNVPDTEYGREMLALARAMSGSVLSGSSRGGPCRS